MSKYILFGWSGESDLADELLGTTSEIELVNDRDSALSPFKLRLETQEVRLSYNLFRGKSFVMQVLYSCSDNNRIGKKLIAYYRIPGT